MPPRYGLAPVGTRHRYRDDTARETAAVPRLTLLVAIVATGCTVRAAAPAAPTTTITTTTIATTITTTIATTVVTDVTAATTPPPESTPNSIAEPTSGPRVVTVAFSGDTLPHSPLWRRAARNAGDPDGSGDRGHDFAPMFAGLEPVIGAADLAVCHLETPIAPVGEEFSTHPYYGVPEGIVDAIASAGYDRCSTASNHAADRGVAGVDRTVDALESRGIDQSGMARRPSEIEPAVFEVDGVAFSHLSYTFSFNGLSFPADQPWRSAVIDPARIIADAAGARALGADVVLVSMHWGVEGVSEPTGAQRAIADEITASGAIDIVIGHHAHVVQPIESVNGTWVVYGLGNILSNLPTTARWPAASQDGIVVTAELTVGEDGRVEVSRPVAHPTWVDKEAGWVVRLVDDELARDDIGDGQRGRLERSRERTQTVVGEFMAARDR
jgi:poly-gamma-glutamate capsule biosynthesis protein CapA/YwtB (metallophosphatase superfamily)